MSKSEEQARNDPHSLAPIAIGGTDDDQDLAKMHRGNGLRITLALLVAAGAIIGGAQLLRSMDTRSAYVSAAAALERSDTEQRETFLRCALPNYQRSQVSNGSSLRGAIDSQSERMERGYAKLLGKCTPLLADFQQAVTDIKAPDDVAKEVGAVNKAATDLGSAFNDYREHLVHAQSYDATQAEPFTEAISSSWQSYLSAREQAKQAISAHL